MTQPMLILGLLAAALVGCQAPMCERADPPYAFEVALYYSGTIDDLSLRLEAESGTDQLWLPYATSSNAVARVDVEWGGLEPEGSLGRLTASTFDRVPVVVVLEAEQDDEGCPITQHADVRWWF